MTKEQEKHLAELFDKLWKSYPADLCKGKRGGKVPAFKAFKKINPDEEEFERIMANMKAQIRADRKEKDPYRWPFVSSYLNQARYDDYIMPSNDEIEREELKTCSVEGCNSEVHGRSFKFCSFHIPNNHGERLREAWVRTGIDSKSPDYIDQCRAYCRERMNLLMGKA